MNEPFSSTTRPVLSVKRTVTFTFERGANTCVPVWLTNTRSLSG